MNHWRSRKKNKIIASNRTLPVTVLLESWLINYIGIILSLLIFCIPGFATINLLNSSSICFFLVEQTYTYESMSKNNYLRVRYLATCDKVKKEFVSPFNYGSEIFKVIIRNYLTVTEFCELDTWLWNIEKYFNYLPYPSNLFKQDESMNYIERELTAWHLFINEDNDKKATCVSNFYYNSQI